MKKIWSIFALVVCFGIGTNSAEAGKTNKQKLEDLQILAQQGDAIAQYDLGSRYEQGEGISKDFDEALRWYEKSAEQGYAHAQSDLGYLYYYGVGVKKDAQAALKWNLKAVEQGDPDAQHNLAVMYDEGTDIPENNEEAVKLYRKAAEQGNWRAQLNLGVCYRDGEGVQQDYVEAYKWLNNARFYSQDKNIKWKACDLMDKLKGLMTVEQKKAAHVPRGRFAY